MPQTDENLTNEENASAGKTIHKDDDLVDQVPEPEKIHLKTKSVPTITTLLGGLCAAVDTFIQRYPIMNSLIIILVTMIIFLIIGDVIKLLLDRIEIIVPVELPEDEAVENGESDEENPEASDEEK